MRTVFTILFLILTSLCYSHISPPVRLLSEEDALKILMPSSLKPVVKHFRLNSSQREDIYRRTGWKPSEKTIRYYVGTDDQGAVRATVLVVSEYTLHGSIRIAAVCDSGGKPTAAELLEVSEEAYNWVKPLIDQNYMKQLVQSSPVVPENAGSMTKYYAEQIAKVVHHVPSLCDLVGR
jgi:hypothetical protein